MTKLHKSACTDSTGKCDVRTRTRGCKTRQQKSQLERDLQNALARIVQLETEHNNRQLALIFGIFAYLTGLETNVTFGANHTATIAADMAGLFAEVNGLVGSPDYNLIDFPNDISDNYGKAH